MRGLTACLLSTALLPTAGCGEVSYEEQMKSAQTSPAAASAPSEGASADSYDGQSAGMMGAVRPADEEREESPPPAAAGGEAVSRKVIYNATLDLAVEGLDAAAARVGALVASSAGYIAEETMTGSPGSTRSQFWKLRIPIDGFDGFVKSVMALGELVQFNRTSQDVTAEFYDVEARIKNMQVQEQTLRKILEERSGQLEDVLKVEVELSRVRGEIERMQGRIRVLQNLSSLATLTLTLRERERFQPPTPVVADFPTQVARTWQASVTQLTDVGKALILFAVAQAVFLPFWAIGLLVAWAIVRRLATLSKSRPTSPGA